ncbi:hypothetical protein C8Q74DRAFT_1306427, partial [Fomes fomentarius]
LLDSRVLCAPTMTVSVYLVLAILILIWSLLGSAATLWSSVAPSLCALVTWGLFVDSFRYVISFCVYGPCLKVCGSYSLSLFVSRVPSRMLLRACLALFVLSRS